ncbi:MAG: hypothetical protein HZC54_13495 [Verrucomicrobia bacterium]|nr:hypothetical protein [Verrucomicrobiota bacterium]
MNSASFRRIVIALLVVGVLGLVFAWQVVYIAAHCPPLMPDERYTQQDAEKWICGLLLDDHPLKTEGITDARLAVQGGGPSDSIFYFRFGATPEALKRILEARRLRVEAGDLTQNYFLQNDFIKAPLSWWKPQSSGTILYRSQHTETYPYNLPWSLLYDPQSQVVYCRSN